ncbi:hypothetical protein [Arthronema virus TR020]|uniref:Uncharacterized protein n=1 Tax=Arthronema virus TR020 TaxID=2736280 RepID=A0A7G3WH31_9CAUD|nr:hypothetical protein [Arthronema virus TR020]
MKLRMWKWIGQTAENGEVTHDMYHDEITDELMLKSMENGKECILRNADEAN